MRSEHTTFHDCRYPEIKSTFLATNYFGSNEGIICRCVRKECVYSREWDYDFHEYHNRTLNGINIAIDICIRALQNPDHCPIGEELASAIKEISADDKNTLIQVLQTVPRRSFPDSIQRISIYIDDKQSEISNQYIGYFDLSPIGVSEIYLSPPLWMTPPKYFLTCQKTYFPDTTLRCTENGTETVTCVPYIKVNTEVGVCAQHAVRMALMTLSQKPPTVPEIVFEAQKTVLRGGVNRDQADGWYPDEIRLLIEDHGYGVHQLSSYICNNCGAVLSTIKCQSCGEEFILSPQSKRPSLENIYAYVESGIPVILGVNNVRWLPWWPDRDGEAHAILAIGHTISEDNRIDGLIVHDESTYPYQVLPEMNSRGKSIDEIIDSVVIPVPREVTIEYPVVKEMLTLLLSGVFEDEDLEKIRYRPLLLDSHHAKKLLGEEHLRAGVLWVAIPEEAKNAFLSAYLDRYVWLFELREETDDGNCEYLGDFVFSSSEPGLLCVNVVDGFYAYKESKEDDIIIKNY